MSELTFEVKEFIEDNIELINDAKWDQVYDNARFTLDSTSTGGVTQALLDCGIDPIVEGDLDYIPEYYLSDTNIETFDVPSTVVHLGEGCFSYSKLKKMIIPEQVKSVGSYAFYDCFELREIIFLTDNCKFGAHFLSHFPEDLIIRCKKDSRVSSYLQSELEFYDADSQLEYI